MKNVRVRVWSNCSGSDFDYGIYGGGRWLIKVHKWYEYEADAIRYAKVFAKKVGIKFDPKIVKQHGC